MYGFNMIGPPTETLDLIVILSYFWRSIIIGITRKKHMVTNIKASVRKANAELYRLGDGYGSVLKFLSQTKGLRLHPYLRPFILWRM